MPDFYGAPAALTGSELVTIYQQQNGNMVLCSMTLNALLAWVQAQGGTGGGISQAQFDTMAATWVASLPTTLPSQGPYLDGGVLSFVP